MASFAYAGTEVSLPGAGFPVIGGSAPTMKPDNENLELMTGCDLTPAEVIQWARREKKRLSLELAKDARLWKCPKHRRDWIITLGIEQLVLAQCYGIRDA